MRVTRLSYVASQAFVVVLALGSLAVAWWIHRYWTTASGTSYGDILARAGDAPLKVRLVLYAPILLCVAAVVGLIVAVLLRRPRGWLLAVTALSAPLALAGSYAAQRIIMSAEGSYYESSKYTALYRKGAYPLAVLCAVYVLVLAIDVAWLARRRGVQAASP